MKNVGTFEIETGVVRVTDPCYDRDVWCSGSLENVKTGKWNAFANISYNGMWDGMVKELCVSHIEHRNNGSWETAPFEVGVDSGQAGVFDDKYYKDDNIVKDVARINDVEAICKDEPWYSICCDRTLSEKRVGVIPFGAVSSSGFGDGGYKAFFQKNKDGKIDAIKIIFVEDEEENDECDDED